MEQNLVHKELGNRINAIRIGYDIRSINQFERECKINNGTLNKVIREGGSMRSDTLGKILIRFPKVNARWLVTGHGRMHSDDFKSRMNEALEEQVERLHKQNDYLIEILQNQNERIKEMLRSGL